MEDEKATRERRGNDKSFDASQHDAEAEDCVVCCDHIELISAHLQQ